MRCKQTKNAPMASPMYEPELEDLLARCRETGQAWSNEELAVLRQYYTRFRDAGQVAKLAEWWLAKFPPGRTHKALRSRAAGMGLANSRAKTL